MLKIKNINKIIISRTAFILIAFMLTFSCMNINALANTYEKTAVFDDAGLFSEEEAAYLEETADIFTEQTGVNMMIITTNDNLGKEVRLYGADFYEEQAYTDKDMGVFLVIDMDGRKVAVVTSEASINYFPVDVTDKLTDNAYEYLSEADYYGAADHFIADALDAVTNYGVKPVGKILLISLAVGALIGGFVAGILAATHGNLSGASAYTRDYLSGGLELTQKQDRFVTTHTVRTAIPKNNDNNSSSGGSTTSSSGGSYSGSSRSF